MMSARYELIVIGAGPAGLAAACAAWDKGLRRILVLEREAAAGGILKQCIHNGFGLQYFKEELTGPEYALRFEQMLAERPEIELVCDSMVLAFWPWAGEEGGASVYGLEVLSVAQGLQILQGETIVLAMGCRERSRGALAIPGSRPAGVLTAGTAQRYVNIDGYMPGRKVLILGSGDIGLIMARRMTLEGAEVLACLELMPHPGGLARNLVQCLDDFSIPLYLRHTVTKIEGKNRVEAVWAAEVAADGSLVPGTEKRFEVDTLLLSVGLIPENELSVAAGLAMDKRSKGCVVYENMECSQAGVFACGNVLHVHDLVDYVTLESQRAGAAAAEFVLARRASESKQERVLEVSVDADTVLYALPQKLRLERCSTAVKIFLRSRQLWREPVEIQVWSQDKLVARYKREHLAPAEMEQITLPAVLGQNLPTNELKLKIASCKEAK